MKVPTSKVDNYGTGSIHQNKYILCTGKIFMRSGNRSHFGESFESLLFLAFYFRILTQWMRWCRQKFSKKNQAIWAKNEPQKMASLTAGGTCSCIIVQCTKIHYTQCYTTLQIQLDESSSISRGGSNIKKTELRTSQTLNTFKHLILNLTNITKNRSVCELQK